MGLGLEAFLDEPAAHSVAIQGDTVLFRCAVGPHVTATLAWKDIDTGTLLTKGPGVDPEQRFEKSTRDRLTLIGDRANGEYHLQIQDVVGDDGGRYCCHYYDEATGTDYNSNVVTLTVMTPPDDGYPVCQTEPSFGRFNVGDNVTLVCESRGGNPPAALTWIRERDILDVKYTPGTATPLNRVSLVLSEQDVDKKFVCLARNPATKQPLSCSVKPLRSAITARVAPSTMRADPGADAVFNCISEPIDGLVYTWYVNDQLVDGSHRRFSTRRGGKRLKIFPVISQDDFTLVTCVVEHPTIGFDLMGTATALFWVNLDANPNFVYDTTPEPTKISNRLPGRIYDNVHVTELPVLTEGFMEEEGLSTTPPVRTTRPAGIHKGSNGGLGLVDTNGITIDINKLLETLIDPDFLNETIVTEVPATLPPLELETTTAEFIDTTPQTTEQSKVTTTESNKLCRGDTCIEETTQKIQTTKPTNTTENEISNVISEMVTPPKEKGINLLQPQGDSPITREKEPSNGLAIGLSLGLIFLTIIVLIIAFILWRNRSAKQKEQDKEKQKPAAKKTTTPAKKTTK